MGCDYDMMLEFDFRDRSFFYLEAFQAHFPGVSVAFDIRNTLRHAA